MLNSRVLLGPFAMTQVERKLFPNTQVLIDAIKLEKERGLFMLSKAEMKLKVQLGNAKQGLEGLANHAIGGIASIKA